MQRNQRNKVADNVVDYPDIVPLEIKLEYTLINEKPPIKKVPIVLKRNRRQRKQRKEARYINQVEEECDSESGGESECESEKKDEEVDDDVEAGAAAKAEHNDKHNE